MLTVKSINWILTQFPKPLKSSALLYRASTNGWKRADFWKYCNDKGPTLCIFKSSVGRIFGGFTMATWSKHGEWVKDKEAFLFSTEM